MLRCDKLLFLQLTHHHLTHGLKRSAVYLLNIVLLRMPPEGERTGRTVQMDDINDRNTESLAYIIVVVHNRESLLAAENRSVAELSGRTP